MRSTILTMKTCLPMLVVAALALGANAFYMPGVAPKAYAEGEVLNIKVTQLVSKNSALRFDYYHVPFCPPEEQVEYSENLGEALLGEKSMSSPYTAETLVDKSCQVVCRRVYKTDEIQEFIDFGTLEYRVNMRADNLPVSEVYTYLYTNPEDASAAVETSETYMLGYPVGSFVEVPAQPHATERAAADEEAHMTHNEEFHINNHLRFTVLHHEDDRSDESDPEAGPGEPGVYIVGFHVEASSIRHHGPPDWRKGCEPAECRLQTCKPDEGAHGSPLTLEPDAEEVEVIWTYDVVWEKSSVKWISRWDIYLKLEDARIHWFSVINSTVVVLFLTVIVGLIMVRILRKDLAMYDDLAEEADPKEESGWKLLHGDVFRAPTRPALLATIMGQGLQLLLMIICTLFFSLFGILSPSNRGSLMTCIVLAYFLTSFSSGYLAARLCKTFGVATAARVIILTATVIPGVVFGICFLINLFVWSRGSSGAIPFGTIIAVALLWFGVSAPLVFGGSYLGFRRGPYEVPCRTHQIARAVPPRQWYLQQPACFLIGGILPFSVVFVELTVIMGSLLHHRFYYLFGFLALVCLLTFAAIAEVSIICTYSQLTAENHRWWWLSWFEGGATAFYVFAFAIYYYVAHVQSAGLGGVLSFGIHCGYSLVLSFLLFIMFGFISAITSFIFVVKIYGVVKTD